MKHRPLSPQAFQKAMAEARAQKQQLGVIVRVSFVGGPLDRGQAALEIPQHRRGTMIQFEKDGHLYRSTVPFKGQAAMALIHAASPIAARPTTAGACTPHAEGPPLPSTDRR